MTLAIALAAGAVIGILLGLLGGGGSILAVPVLVFALGLDIDQAIPISIRSPHSRTELEQQSHAAERR
ncbi:hypothetical protein J6397_30490 [Rhodococcus qingshengii]|nr:hypothetical protein [Rhodococcus qingshengii]